MPHKMTTHHKKQTIVSLVLLLALSIVGPADSDTDCWADPALGPTCVPSTWIGTCECEEFTKPFGDICQGSGGPCGSCEDIIREKSLPFDPVTLCSAQQAIAAQSQPGKALAALLPTEAIHQPETENPHLAFALSFALDEAGELLTSEYPSIVHFRGRGESPLWLSLVYHGFTTSQGVDVLLARFKSGPFFAGTYTRSGGFVSFRHDPVLSEDVEKLQLCSVREQARAFPVYGIEVSESFYFYRSCLVKQGLLPDDDF